MRIIGAFCLVILSATVVAQGKFVTDAALAYNANDFVGAQKSLDKAWEIILQKKAAGEPVKAKEVNKYYKLKAQTYVRLADVYNGKADSSLMYADTAFSAAKQYLANDASKYYEAEVKDALIQTTYYYQNVGVYYYQKQDYANAFEVFEKVVLIQKEINPVKNDLPSYHNAAFAAFYSKKFNRSIPYFNILIDSNYNTQSSLVEYKQSIVRAHLEMGDTNTAVHKLQEFNTGDTIVEFLKEEVAILLAQNKQKEALARMQILVDKQINDALVYENVAKIYQQLGEYSKSRDAYNSALKIDEKRVDSHYGLGALLVIESNLLAGEKQRNKLKEALVPLERARSLAPNDKDTLKALLQIYTNLEMKDKAKEIKDAMGN